MFALILALALAVSVAMLGLILFRRSVRRVVPPTARFLALAFAGGWIWFALSLTAVDEPPLFRALASVGGAVFGAALILSLGYVYGDARRRGMPAFLWTLAAFAVPNLVGFLLFFLLRKPLLVPCSRCGRGLAHGQLFCPACGAPRPQAESAAA